MVLCILLVLIVLRVTVSPPELAKFFRNILERDIYVDNSGRPGHQTVRFNSGVNSVVILYKH